MSEINKKKITVGIAAAVSTIAAVVLWVAKLKYKKQVGIGVLLAALAVSAILWVWYANLPSFGDSNTPMSELDQTFDTVTKGDLQ